MKLRGFVHEIKEQNDKQWLVIDRHGERQAIEFRPKCEVRINGSADEAGRPLAPADLKPGDRISVTHDSHVTAVDATRRDRVTGSVLKIDQAAHTVLVRASTGDEVTFDVGDKCDISIDEAPAELADLRKYDRIEVTFDSREGGPGAARTIDARRPKDPK
jgi:hypothetical protein